MRLDFYQIKRRVIEKKDYSYTEVYPDFKVCRSEDLMVRGKAFYAIWDEERGLWSTDEYDVQRLIDQDLYSESKKIPGDVVVKKLSDFSSKSWAEFRKYLNHISDNYHQLDNKIIFMDDETGKNDYASKKLPYSLRKGSIEAYDELMSTLYDPEERAKIEWAIGAIFSGDAKKIQKFMVLYGEAGSGKSTILNILQKLFESYYVMFEAKALTSSNNAFSTEVFKANPLVAIQHDGDLSKIEDNTKLNSIVSHEEMVVNEKFKASYTSVMNCFLFMATNRPVKITDAKSGIIRRLIDIRPSGRKIPYNRYSVLMEQVNFELGAIAYHCLDVYRGMGKNYYEAYRPLDMMFKTDIFFNFVEDSYPVFKGDDGVSLKAAYAMYKAYCDESGTDFRMPMYKFREELKNYFKDFKDVVRIDGKQIRSYYQGFKSNIFMKNSDPEEDLKPYSLVMDCDESILDKYCKDEPAQYATANETPISKWDDVTTKLSDIDTKRLHYVKLPPNHIVIDFDLKDEDGNKSYEKNVEAASKWPSTYAELSKGGSGVHLHYIYEGDPTKLSRVFDQDIEIKVFTGNSSLRRRLTKCNNTPISAINSGLPLKGDKKVINLKAVQSEKGLRSLIQRNLNKEIHPGTKPSIDFIYKILEDAYNSDIYYDISDMRAKILSFANNSTHQSDYCVKLVAKMKFKSENASVPPEYEDDTLVFYDVEVFPNLFLVNWKVAGDDKSCVRMINPTSKEIEDLFRFKLIGFNCRKYDNHILYGRYIGYNNEQLYNLSSKIISGDNNAMFREAYSISYTDVYDFASAGNKKSLKKFEIELDIHHQELGLPWDEPVPEDKWIQVAEYCDNDVIATEAVFNHLSGDWTARQILADLAGMTVNDTTNTLTTKIIFGNNRKPQSHFLYRNLSKPVAKEELTQEVIDFLTESCPEMMSQPFVPYIGGDESVLPYFPGYKYRAGKSTYLEEEIGEGGRVYAEPGMYTNVALLDITSMHPSSIIAECLFGPDFTKRFKEIVYGRVDIKHEAWDEIDKILDGKLTPYIQKVINGEMTSGELANALKTAINSVYGLTAAKFDNAFNDPRNKDNIVAKRGALFMTDLKKAVQAKGYTVAHIKTDSIKIPNASKEIVEFVKEFGKKYGYNFEHEATYSKMCLVNDAVYIAKVKEGKHAGEWSATGAQFAHPYVFKTLFSKEPIEFKDLCEAKLTTSAFYLDMNEGYPNVTQEERELADRIYNSKLEEDQNPRKLNPIFEKFSDEELQETIAKGHNYIFVGKSGAFCPIKDNCGAGLLKREKDGKYYAATGSNGYRWMESEDVANLNKQDDIDLGYFNGLVADAIDNISQYGDFEWFASDEDLEVPPWEDDDLISKGESND